jgi:dihydroorotase
MMHFECHLPWLLLITGVAAAQAPAPYDLLLKGGHVIDPKNKIDTLMDVAIAGGKIAQVAPDIAASQARMVVPVDGLLVVPGLVDMHVHVFAGTMSGEYTGEFGVRPDGFTFRSGVTTVVDAGSSGWRNFAEFKQQTVDHSLTRVLAMLNIVGHGMGGRMTVEQIVTDMDAVPTAETARQYRDLVVGIKVAHYDGPDWVPYERAVEAGKRANLPVMIDFATFRPERPFQDLVLHKLRPGDIYTHMYLSAVPMLDDQGRVFPYLFEARKRGIIFDVGHGGGSFSWRQAVPAIRQGFVPDSISTDLHVQSMNAGMKDMVTTMSKILNLGVSLADVIKMSTMNPAQEIKRPELGNLSVGAGADVAVLRLKTGDFGFLDAGNSRYSGTQKLECELTVRNGRVVWDLNGRTGVDWQKAVPRRPSRKEP